MAKTMDAVAAQVRLEELAREQGVHPIEDPSSLVADFWPEDETADEFIAAVQAWRHEGNPQQP